MENHEERLRRLAIRDGAYIQSVLARDSERAPAAGLDARTRALARLAALIAADASTPSYLPAVEAALAAGSTVDELVAVLEAVMPVVGVDRVVAAAPRLGLAVGYDVGNALEELAGGGY